MFSLTILISGEKYVFVGRALSIFRDLPRSKETARWYNLSHFAFIFSYDVIAMNELVLQFRNN